MPTEQFGERVRLFLPNFDTDAVLAVKEKLESDPEGPASTVTIDSVDARKNPELSSGVFDAFSAMPSYVVPGPVHRSQVARLHKLATLLIGDGLLENAVEEADGYLVSVMESERVRLNASGLLKPLLKDVQSSEMAVADFAIHNTAVVTHTVSMESDVGDINRIFRAASRKFSDGLADRYWQERVSIAGDDAYYAKVLTIALSMESSVVQKVEREAEGRVKQWLRDYGASIASLSEDQKSRYAEVRAMAQSPEIVSPALPSIVTMQKDDPAWRKHLYADARGNFNLALGGWEESVLKTEMAKDSFVGWYRNPAGGDRALRVPYESGNGWKSLYPDFIIFSRNADGIICASILDPHGHYLADTGSKWRGLGAYAAKHGDTFARVEAIIEDEDGHMVFMDLKDPTVRAALDKSQTAEDIAALFKQFGSVCK